MGNIEEILKKKGRCVHDIAHIGLNFGVIGFGVLGRATAALAQGLGMNLLIAERRGRTPRPGRLNFSEVVSTADVLSIHCPLTEETSGLIDREVLRTMKPDAVLINTARGAIIREQDLADCLREGIIAGAGLDVFETEPLPESSPLWNLPNVIITPHDGGNHNNRYASWVETCFDNLERHATGTCLRNIVDKQAGY